jgi:hypothetical protein
MSHTSALLRRLQRPHIADMADAVHLDAAALANEWSRGDDLSMISANSVATENISRILLLASAAALKDAGDDDMAGIVESYLRGRQAEMQFANRDQSTDDALDVAANELTDMACVLGSRFINCMSSAA